MRFFGKILLSPYYLILYIRHALYNWNLIRSRTFDKPVISIGNINVGGTGKTPHCELLVRLLKDDYKVAVISRGYKRKSKGFRIVSTEDSYKTVGDEPLQIKLKFPDITVAVDKSRSKAIERLNALPKDQQPDLYILDDAFQHRKIKPSRSIVLIDYYRPVWRDLLLPFGNLRDLPSRIKSADIIVVTKSPEYVPENDREMWRKRLKLKPEQSLLFSKINYSEPSPVHPETADSRYVYSKKAILFTGIVNNQPLINYLINSYQLFSVINFGDHHNFKKKDLRRIARISEKSPTSVLLTTEKDAQRVRNHPGLTSSLRSKLFYVPIEVSVIPSQDSSISLVEQEKQEIGAQELKNLLF